MLKVHINTICYIVDEDAIALPDDFMHTHDVAASLLHNRPYRTLCQGYYAVANFYHLSVMN